MVLASAVLLVEREIVTFDSDGSRPWFAFIMMLRMSLIAFFAYLTSMSLDGAVLSVVVGDQVSVESKQAEIARRNQELRNRYVGQRRDEQLLTDLRDNAGQDLAASRTANAAVKGKLPRAQLEHDDAKQRLAATNNQLEDATLSQTKAEETYRRAKARLSHATTENRAERERAARKARFQLSESRAELALAETAQSQAQNHAREAELALDLISGELALHESTESSSEARQSRFEMEALTDARAEQNVADAYAARLESWSNIVAASVPGERVVEVLTPELQKLGEEPWVYSDSTPNIVEFYRLLDDLATAEPPTCRGDAAGCAFAESRFTDQSVKTREKTAAITRKFIWGLFALACVLPFLVALSKLTASNELKAYYSSSFQGRDNPLIKNINEHFASRRDPQAAARAKIIDFMKMKSSSDTAANR